MELKCAWNGHTSEVSFLSKGLKFNPTQNKQALKYRRYNWKNIEENFSLSGTLEMMDNLL